jgi:hypothetical protein
MHLSGRRVQLPADRVHMMPSSALDEFIPRIGREVTARRTVLKMDVEKHELFVLKGASEFFRGLQPLSRSLCI